jgi:hypothetical protein
MLQCDLRWRSCGISPTFCLSTPVPASAPIEFLRSAAGIDSRMRPVGAGLFKTQRRPGRGHNRPQGVLEFLNAFCYAGA